jgi:enoyl-CoA hydratase
MKEIVLNGPGKNCLSLSMMEFLITGLREANGGPVLLTGAGDAFSAGLDLKEVASLDAGGLERYLRKLETMVDALYRHEGPVVAAVNGHAIAGGCMLLLCCDFKIAARNPKLKIGLNELALGVRFPPVTLAVVKDRVPAQHHNKVILGAGLFDPIESLRLGLVDELADDPLRVAKDRLATLAGYSAGTFAATKAALLAPRRDPAAVEREFLDMLPAWNNPETHARIVAVLKPKS